MWDFSPRARACWRAVMRGAALASAALTLAPAHALPSYARQTGMDCAGCHVGGFGPQLTPTGIRFKIGGYTDSDGKDGKVPLSAMVVASGTHTRKDQEPVPHVSANNNVRMDEASVFFAGRVTDSIGGFAQLTYDGIAHSTALDHVDLRFARSVTLGGRDTTLGLSVNNNPTVQDPFNTLPAWRAPYIASAVAPGTGDAASLINGGLEHRVMGVSAYASYNDNLYGELGTYTSLSPSTQRNLGLDRDYQKLGGNAYWRLAWMQDFKSHAYHVGVFGWNADVLPDRTAGGPKNRYRDLGVDAGYQFLGTREHMATLSGSYVREHLSDIDRVRSSLHETRLNASYHFRQTWGLSGGYFNTRGSDPGAATRGQMVQLDWTPWGKEGASAPAPIGFSNLRLGLQYWHYNKFGGVGSGARDHDTTYLFAWLSF